MNEQLKLLKLPTIYGFLETLAAHANADAPMGQWGYFPQARGEDLTAELAATVPGAEKWVGETVFDANGLVEVYVDQILKDDIHARLEYQYKEWCYGHVGDVIEDMVQLPGGAVFKADADGRFTDAAYLYRKNGANPLDWDIFVCNDVNKGLCIEKLDDSWTHWGLISMVMRYNVHGLMTCDLLPPPIASPYGVVWSSVLNFRAKGDRHLVTSVPNGTVVALTGNVDGDWTECVIGDQVGYVFSCFLVKHNLSSSMIERN